MEMLNIARSGCRQVARFELTDTSDKICIGVVNFPEDFVIANFAVEPRWLFVFAAPAVLPNLMALVVATPKGDAGVTPQPADLVFGFSFA